MVETMKNILYGGYEGSDTEVCENCQSLGELLIKRLRAAGKQTVLVDGITGVEISGNAFLSKSIHLGKYIENTFGIGVGDVVSVCSENRIEFAVTTLATILIGATISPFNHSYSESELNHMFNLSKPKIIFVSPPFFDKIFAVAQRNPFVKHIILYDSLDEMKKNSNILSFNEMMQLENASNILSFKCQPQDMKENVTVILCSSGTTGLPKGVQLTQFNFILANVQYQTRPQKTEVPPNGERVILGHLPMYHAFGVCVFITTLLTHHARFVLLPRFTMEGFLHTIQTHKITNAFLVPPIMVFLAKSSLISKYDLSSLHTVICGAAPLSKKIEMSVKERIGVQTVRQGYGMTECTYIFTCQNDQYHTNGSVGVLAKGIHARVVDVESGKLLGPNETGELHFKGKNNMKGYIGNLQATSATIDTDGWLHTGDIGYYDENGEFYIVDRIKELIKYKAFQVAPAELEALLLTNPKIKDAGVVGVPHEEAGEAAFAFVVKQENAQITEHEVIQYVAERLSKPKHLHGGVKFLDAIPKSLTGKILRRVLRDIAKNQKSKL